MKKFLIKWLVNTAALWVVVWVIPGITTTGWRSLVAASLILGLLNTFIRPLINFVTLPLQILSLGLLTLIINGFLFFLLAYLVDGFIISGYGSAFWGALVLSIMSFLLNIFFLPGGNVHMYYRSNQTSARSKNKNVIDTDGHVK